MDLKEIAGYQALTYIQDKIQPGVTGNENINAPGWYQGIMIFNVIT
jgi:hypothetical protein